MKPSDVLSKQEREALLQRSDLRAWWLVLSTWLLIFGLLLLVGYFPSVLTVLLAWIVLPGRQLSLAVLMHEAGHGSLFRTKQLQAVSPQIGGAIADWRGSFTLVFWLAALVALIGAMAAWSLPEDDIEVRVDVPTDV